MYLICVDFSENNLLTEQLGVRSFYDLPVLNNTLLYHQLMSFSDLDIDNALLINNEKITDFSVFNTKNINSDAFEKLLFDLKDNEKLILFRNDVYSEANVSQYIKVPFNINTVTFTEKQGICIFIVTTVGFLRKLFSRNIGIKDLFVNSEKFSDINITLDCYVKYFKSVKCYKEFLFDILNERLALIKPPRLAEGVFVKENVPKGDFSIIPPVYIGSTVQIEAGSRIGPDTVIYDNTLISSNTIIKNSILLGNVFVSSNCYVDGAVFCENSSVKRNSAVFSGTVLGENALIGEDMIVEPDSLIKKNVKFDTLFKSPLSDKVNSEYTNKFQGLSPEKAGLLGSAIATVFNKPKIIIASDGSPNSTAIKLALLSGLIASGAECFDMGSAFKSQVFFGLLFCECSYCIFVTGEENGTDVEIFDYKNEALSKADCCNLLDFCNKKEFVFVSAGECKNVRQIRGLKKMYVREITSVFNGNLNVKANINCANTFLNKTLQDIFNKTVINNNDNSSFYININESGSKAVLKYKNKNYNEKTLKKLVHYYTKKNNNLLELKNKYYKNLYRKDIVFLLMSVLYIIDKTKKELPELVQGLPDFFVCSKSFNCSMKNVELAEKFSEFNNCFYKKGAFNLPLKTGGVRLKNCPENNKIRILCSSEKMSASEEICNILGQYIAPTDA